MFKNIVKGKELYIEYLMYKYIFHMSPNVSYERQIDYTDA